MGNRRSGTIGVRRHELLTLFAGTALTLSGQANAQLAPAGEEGEFARA
jgi:hypothetical protein